MNFLYEHFYGLANLGIVGYVVVTLLWLHATLIAVTLYYHRDQAHRSVDLHPVVRHICRFWLWLNTGSSTREWVAVHRKHHAHCEKEGDPHSPRVFGLKKVCSKAPSSIASRRAIRETLEKYAKGTPNDWLENNLYHHPARSYFGICAARRRRPRAVRRAGHHHDRAAARRTCRSWRPASSTALSTRRATATSRPTTRSTNLWPLGICHRGRGAAQQPPCVSDVGAVLDAAARSRHGLAAPEGARVARAREDSPRRRSCRSSRRRRAATPELDELRAIIVHRMHVLRHYTYNVTLPVLRRELESLGENANSLLRATRRHLSRHPEMLDELVAASASTELARAPSAIQDRARSSAASSSSSGKARTRATSACSRTFASGARAPSRAASKASQEFVAYLRSFRAMREPALA